MTEDLDLILVAKRAQDNLIEFTSPSSSNAEDSDQSCTNAAEQKRRSPLFSMTYSKESDEWLLAQCRCDGCVHRPHHLTCEFIGRSQQVALICHRRRKVEKANV